MLQLNLQISIFDLFLHTFLVCFGFWFGLTLTRVTTLTTLNQGSDAKKFWVLVLGNPKVLGFWSFGFGFGFYVLGGFFDQVKWNFDEHLVKFPFISSKHQTFKKIFRLRRLSAPQTQFHLYLETKAKNFLAPLGLCTIVAIIFRLSLILHIQRQYYLFIAKFEVVTKFDLICQLFAETNS